MTKAFKDEDEVASLKKEMETMRANMAKMLLFQREQGETRHLVE